MEKKTTVKLGNHFDEFIHDIIESGRYTSVSEVIRSALRMLESEEKKEIELVASLRKGEDSGFIEDFDSKSHLKELHRQKLQSS